MTNDKRRAIRKPIAMDVVRRSGLDDIICAVSDISPTGIRIKKELSAPCTPTPICNLELHLAKNAITTVIAGRSVWENDSYEAFEFISPSFAQQMMLEKMAGNL